MTTQELIVHQLDGVKFQLSKVYEGLAEGLFDEKPLGHLMSAREQANHLCEVYEACEKTARGEKHEWGTFTDLDLPTGELVAEMLSRRDNAAKLALEAGKIDLVSDFLVVHDAYHVGQMVTLRLAVEPEWNSYSIYNHG